MSETHIFTDPSWGRPASTSPHSVVESPAGVWLAVGLLGPYLTDAGKAEVEQRWGFPVDVMFAQALEVVARFREDPVVCAAVALWTRDHDLPSSAQGMLSQWLQLLPHDVALAQQVLDQWAAENTNQIIKSFPVKVQEETRVVLGSAVAMDDTWECAVEGGLSVFKGQRRDGFTAWVEDAASRATADAQSVRVRLPLSSGMYMDFALSTHGVQRALELLTGTDEVFTEALVAGNPFVEEIRVSRDTDLVVAGLPEFTISSLHDLMDDAARWGLVEATKPFGVPGLGDLMEISEAKQDAFIEVTKEGVRAAAVTGMAMLAGSFMMPSGRQRTVDFDSAFAFAVWMPGLGVPLFQGVFDG